VPLKILTTTILKKDGARQGNTLTIAQIEALLGQPGKTSFSRQMAGAQVWVDYTDVWSIAASEHRFLIVSGHQPARDWQMGATGGLPVSSYSLISMAPGCLPPVSDAASHQTVDTGARK
jgi:hypothetical protein